MKAIQAIIEEGWSSEGVKLVLGLLCNMFDFSVFYGLHMNKEIFSATELLAAGLQKKNSAGEAVQCKDVLEKNFAKYERKCTQIL